MSGKWIPPMLFVTLVAFLYSVYTSCNLLPQMFRLLALDRYNQRSAQAYAAAEQSSLYAQSGSGPGNLANFNAIDFGLHVSSVAENAKGMTNSEQWSLINDPHVHQSSMQEWLAVVITFHLSFIMLIVSTWRTALEDPGWIPKNKRWKAGAIQFEITDEQETLITRIILDVNRVLSAADKELIQHMPVVERKQKNGHLRECQLCNTFKPDRCHHCKICGRCVLRMDHHCPWLANCVGFNNYKFFVLMLFYAVICMGFIIMSMLPRFLAIFQPILNFWYFLRMDVPVFFAYVISVFVFSALISFFGFHVNLCLSALTTIEMKEQKNNVDKRIHHRFSVAHVKFNDGAYANFCHIFGKPWMWLLPIQPVRPGYDGTYSHTPVLEP